MLLFISFFGAFVVVFPIYLISLAITTTDKRRKKAIEKAIARGHVVTAEWVKQIGDDIPASEVKGIHQETGIVGLQMYRYTYKGKKYTYRMWDSSPPHYTLTLYFLKNPRKANTGGGIADSTTCWPLVYAIVTMLFYWIMKS